VRVRVANVDMDERQVDFELAQGSHAMPARRRPRRRRG